MGSGDQCQVEWLLGRRVESICLSAPYEIFL